MTMEKDMGDALRAAPAHIRQDWIDRAIYPPAIVPDGPLPPLHLGPWAGLDPAKGCFDLGPGLKRGNVADITEQAMGRIRSDCITLAGEGIGGDPHSVWFVSWGDKPIEFKLRLRLTYRQWSLAIDHGNLAEVREWLATAETVLTKAIRATSPSLQAEHARFAAMASAWKEVTR